MRKLLPVLAACALLAGCGFLDIATPRQTGPSATLPPAPTAVSVTATAIPAVTPTPAPTLTPEPTPEPTAPPIAGTVKLRDAGSVLYARVGPGRNETAVGVIENGAVVPVLETVDGWCRIRFGERELYASADYITLDPAATPPEDIDICYYVRPTTGVELVDDPKGTVDEDGNKVKIEKEVIDNLVDVTAVIPSVDIVMIFSTPDNFTGTQYYPDPVCLLQKGTAEKLRKAQEKFMADGYCIRVYDAYRPLSVQKKLFEFVGGNRTYIASPEVGSKHNRGAAVDMTLIDSEGNELEMPSPIHTMNTDSSRKNPNMTEQARKNMDYMTDIMVECGFTPYNGEWWHFNDKDFDKYMLTDYDLSKVLLYIRKPG